MGQAKYNPTAIAAKNGEVPPKKKRAGKRETERMLIEMLVAKNRLMICPFNPVTTQFRIQQELLKGGY